MPRIRQSGAFRMAMFVLSLACVVALWMAGSPGVWAAGNSAGSADATGAATWQVLPVEIQPGDGAVKLVSAFVLRGNDGDGALLTIEVRNESAAAIQGFQLTLIQQKVEGGVHAFSRRWIRHPLGVGETARETIAYPGGFFSSAGAFSVKAEGASSACCEDQPAQDFQKKLDACVKAAKDTCGADKVKSVKVTADSCEFTCK